MPATRRYQNYPAHPTGVGPLRFPIPAGHPQIDRERRRSRQSQKWTYRIQALYWQIIGSQWLIPRTLDPTHIPSTTTSNSWVSFLKHPTFKIHEIRKDLLIYPYIPTRDETLRFYVRDSMYHVQPSTGCTTHRPQVRKKRGHKKPMRPLLVSKWATPGRNHQTHPLCLTTAHTLHQY